MAFTGSTRNYTSSAKWTAVTAWAVGAAKTVGNLVRQLAAPSFGNERVFVCIVAGTTHATTEPTWTFTKGDKITDNTVTWQECTGSAAVNGDLTNTPNWVNGAKNTNISQGHIIKDAAGTHIFICSISGNAGSGVEPTWNTAALGNTTVDSGVTWVYIGASFSAWAAPHHHIRNATNDFSATQFFIGNNHAMNYGGGGYAWVQRGSITAPVDVLCVNESGSMPPVSADLTTGAVEQLTGSNNYDVAGWCRMIYGITINSGRGLGLTNDHFGKYYEKCTFILTSNVVLTPHDGGAGYVICKDCTVKFGNVGSGFQTGFGNFDMIGGGMDPTTTVPTQFLLEGGTGSRYRFQGVDLSALTGTTFYFGQNGMSTNVEFVDCKFPSAFTFSTITTNPQSNSDEVFFSRCDNGATVYKLHYQNFSGAVDADPLVARATGATDGTTPFSYKMASSANTNLGNQPLRAPQSGIPNTAVGSNVTVTTHGIVNAAALPTNVEVWMDVDYLGTAGNPRSVRASTRAVDPILAAPSNLAADTGATWNTGSIAARANSTAYALGDVIKLASNAGRVFFCTTAGTTTSSEPGGYATATDGSTPVADGTAAFRAGVRFKMSVTLSAPQPQLAGNLYATFVVAKPSTTYYLDPFIELT